MQIVKGTPVECVDCDGRHTGTVVRVLGSEWFGVAWNDSNPNYGQPGNTEPQFPDHFVSQHRRHISSVGSLAIRPRA